MPNYSLLQGTAARHPDRFVWISAAITATFLILLMPTAHADATPKQEAQTILHLLDYLSVDYGGSVLFGKVFNEKEFQEQAEFASQSVKLLTRLPAHPSQAALIKEAQELEYKVKAYAPAEEVSASAQQLRKNIIAAYQVPVSPRQIPDSRRAINLYRQLCTACHGEEGHGDGPESKTLIPKPANFHDATRMGQRSVYGLYNTISLGVARTGMVGFTQLSDDERWALAFLVSNFHNQPERMDLGLRLWEEREFKGAIPDLVALTTLTANEVSINHGDNTRAVFEYLRSNPHALVARRPATLIFAAEQLDLTLKYYRDGDLTGAKNFAIAAYLEGFEPMETSLSNLNAQLRLNIEQEMMSIRHLIYEGAPADKLAVNIENAKILLNQADELLREGKLTVIGAFTSSLLILLQKGLVIILTLPTILVFVKRGERRSNALAYIHAGWVSAIFLGILTWLIVTLLGGISGFSRTLISGVTTLAASAMLIYVCFWLNGKTHTPAWQQFLKDKVGTVLEKKALMMLALISFFIVYREIFETVLFYQALWAQTSNITRTALWAGAFTASLIMLTGIWGFFRIGIKLPFGLFFSGTSILFSIMTVIFTGLGLASLQVSGIVGASPVKFISLPLLGVFPTSQTLIAQASVIGILILHQRISRLRPTP